jgi:hypothetical protein
MEKHGLIARSVGDAVALCPPLIITEDQIHEVFDLYEKGLDETEAWVRSDDHPRGVPRTGEGWPRYPGTTRNPRLCAFFS